MFHGCDKTPCPKLAWIGKDLCQLIAGHHTPLWKLIMTATQGRNLEKGTDTEAT